MNDKKQQQVIAACDFSPLCETVISHATEVARIFKCGISIVRVCGKKNEFISDSYEEEKKKLALLAARKSDETGRPFQAYLFSGTMPENIRKIAEPLSAIMVVAGLNEGRGNQNVFSPASLTSDYRDLRIPLLVVRKPPAPGIWDKLVVPVDFNREAKEKGAWASYFGKRNGSAVTLISRNYKDKYFAAALRNNLALIARLYHSLNIPFTIENFGFSKRSADEIGLEFSASTRNSPVFIMASKEVAIDDILFGLPEKKIISSAGDTPIVLLNPRDDLYVPCV